MFERAKSILDWDSKKSVQFEGKRLPSFMPVNAGPWHKQEPDKPKRPPHLQLTASTAMPKIWAPTDQGRERKMQAHFDSFITHDARVSEQIPRKQWLRDVTPDAQVLRLFKAAWNDPTGPLYGQGFITFFRTDRDTLGLIFEDVRGYRHIWVLNTNTRTPRRIGSVA